MSQRFAFPDTNTFLHYPTLDHIDWPDVLGCDAAVIVIAPIVIRELNRHKDAPTSPKSRERAASALRKLHGWSEQAVPIMIRKDVELQFRTHDPLIDFAGERLSVHIADDHLLATMVEFRSENPAGDIVLVTEDLGLRLKSGAHDFSKVQLPADLRLPDELGAEEKRIRQLENELRRVRDRMPALKLLFRNGEDYLTVTVRAPTALAADAFAASLAEVRKKHPKMEMPRVVEETAVPAFAALAVTWGGISPEKLKDYNEALEKYYTHYEKHLLAMQEFENLQRRVARLDIVVVNEGTSPADDIDVFMHFPDGFVLASDDNLPKKPSAPRAPARPKSGLELIQEHLQAPLIPSHYLGSYEVSPKLPEFRNISHPTIRRTKSYDVELTVRGVKHAFSEEFDPMYVIFPTFEEAGSFTIDYRLHAANLPDAVLGQLHVVVERP
jgi:hypothetical protein